MKGYVWKIMMLLLILFPAMTSEIRGEEKTGSLTVNVEPNAQGETPQGMRFALTKVAELEKGEFFLTEAFSSSEVDLNQLSSALDWQNAADMLWQLAKEPQLVQEGDEQGRFVFENLAAGMYLLWPESYGNYEWTKPCLVSMPQWDENSQKMNWQVCAYPKHEAIPVVEIHKVDGVSKELILGKSVSFGVYLDEGCTRQKETLSEDQDGIVEVRVYIDQPIWIQETKAPQGYRLSAQKIKVEAKADGLYIDDQKVDGSNGVAVSYENMPVVPVQTSAHSNHLVYGIALAFSTGLLALSFWKFKAMKK